MIRYTLSKDERLKRRLLIDRLFSGKASSLPAFPLRAVWLEVEGDYPPISLLVSVPKKRFKRAVRRNRIKRQLREAYRHHKHSLWNTLAEKDRKLVLALIWLDNEMRDSTLIAQKVEHLLSLIQERL